MEIPSVLAVKSENDAPNDGREESDQDNEQSDPVLQVLHLQPPQDCCSDPEHGPDINGSPFCKHPPYR